VTLRAVLAAAAELLPEADWGGGSGRGRRRRRREPQLQRRRAPLPHPRHAHCRTPGSARRRRPRRRDRGGRAERWRRRRWCRSGWRGLPPPGAAAQRSDCAAARLPHLWLADAIFVTTRRAAARGRRRCARSTCSFARPSPRRRQRPRGRRRGVRSALWHMLPAAVMVDGTGRLEAARGIMWAAARVGGAVGGSSSRGAQGVTEGLPII